MSKTQLLVGALIAAIAMLVALVFIGGRVTTPADAPTPAPTAVRAAPAPPTPASKPSVAPPRPAPSVAIVAIPAPFRGEWNADIADCGTGNSDTRLRIDANRMRFYESDGAVRSVTVHGERAVTVVGDYAGEGETFTRTDWLELSESRDDLTIDGFTRHRCR